MRFRYRFPFYWEAQSDRSGGPSNNGNAFEQALATTQKQLQEMTSKYEQLQARISSGQLVEPSAFLTEKEKAGEIFPKERYVGLQQTLQKEQESKKAAEDALTALKTSQEELTKTVETLTGTVKEKDTELGTLRQQTERAKIIFDKYPQLASWEAKNLLPSAPPDQLEKVFGEFASSLGQFSVDTTKNNQRGGGSGTPPPEEGNEPKTAQEHLQKANSLLRAGDRAGYDREYDLYVKGLQQEEASK